MLPFYGNQENDEFYLATKEYEVRDLILHLGLRLKLFLDMVPSSPADANARCVDVLACFSRDDQKRNGWEPEGSGIRSIEAVPKMKSYRRCDLKIQPYPFSFFFFAVLKSKKISQEI